MAEAELSKKNVEAEPKLYNFGIAVLENCASDFCCLKNKNVQGAFFRLVRYFFLLRNR